MQNSWKGEAPGFDVEAAIASLAAWILADAVANDVEDLTTRTASAIAKATDHIVMHDHQAETPCLAQPCPTLGVSWSLTLCVMHQRERSVFAPWLEFADQAEHSASEIRKQFRRLRRCVAVLREGSNERHRLEAEMHAPPGAHAHDVLCENPITAVAHCLQTAGELEAAAAAIRKQSNMPEFRKRPPPNRRPLRATDRRLAAPAIRRGLHLRCDRRPGPGRTGSERTTGSDQGGDATSRREMAVC